MSSKEQRSVIQVGRLLNALGRGGAQVRPDIPPRPDVFAEVDGRRIAIETTDYHGDETSLGGSAVRRDERRDAAAGRLRTYAVPADPLHGLVRRIRAKVSKQYDVSAADEAWLAIFAGVPQSGATAATFLLTTFLDCQRLTVHTAPLLETSIFAASYILCDLTETGQPTLYAWERGGAWTQVELPGQASPLTAPTFWDIQKLFKKA